MPHHLKAQFFAAIERQITDRSWKLAPDITDGLHPRLHDLFLQFCGNEVHALGDGLKSSILRSIRELQKLVSRQHEFAYQIHETVEQVDSNANRFDRSIRISGLNNLLRRGDIVGMSRTLRDKDLSQTFAAGFLLFESPSQIFRMDLPAFQEDTANLVRICKFLVR